MLLLCTVYAAGVHAQIHRFSVHAGITAFVYCIRLRLFRDLAGITAFVYHESGGAQCVHIWLKPVGLSQMCTPELRSCSDLRKSLLLFKLLA